ncbi:hypothetical protein LUZ61_006511 [Rhynchospora tenuis]|uniref:Cyclic nucleotide-binding domain-containing protein n=1 Tax=Rhynchospora tenuis TaxID=198213 RepID=A0AAD6EVL5_9POAL|nr:hypothetical protein LUZ61_006511 [Rhynchospora tenuis]
MSSPPSDLSQMLSSSTSGTVTGSSSSPQLVPHTSSSSTAPQSSPPRFKTSWKKLRRKLRICTNSDDTTSGSNSGNLAGSVIECYACTQPGVPAFHSTSCEHAQVTPEWEACAGSSLIPIQHNPASSTPTRNLNTTRKRKQSWIFGAVLDPRSPQVQSWNRALLFARAVALAVDPVFFYAIGVGIKNNTCRNGLIGVVRWIVALATAVRTCADVAHVGHIWVQLRLAYVSRESLVVGSGKLVWDPKEIARHYVKNPKGIWFDLIVVLPLPQIFFWWILPKMIALGQIKLVIGMLLSVFLLQYIPKVYHSIYMMRKMQKVTGYIFGTIWWGFVLNLIAYFIASHVAGSCWYMLAIQRVVSCVENQCQINNSCNLPKHLSCIDGMTFVANQTVQCLSGLGPFNYGIYIQALPVISSASIVIKILYPIFWGLMTLSTFCNNLQPTSQWLEVIFSIIICLSGLMLFTLLIGNIQVFLHAVMARKRKMQLRCRDLEWWMKRRQLPSPLRQRVRQFERERWYATRGEDEMDFIQELPQGLRRDIRRHLCLDLIKQVPLFQHLDDLILDNICDRANHLVYSKDEKVIREGDPVQRMVFVVRGRLQSMQPLTKGVVATSMLGPGSFLGDELLSWCLRRPFIDRLPASSATFVSIEPTEAFGLNANDLRFITEHFRYKFSNEKLKRTTRYYSSNWRTWAAVNIQLAWRRYKSRDQSMDIQRTDTGDSDRRLRLYAAMFLSLRPHDHLE